MNLHLKNDKEAALIDSKLFAANAISCYWSPPGRQCMQVLREIPLYNLTKKNSNKILMKTPC